MAYIYTHAFYRDCASLAPRYVEAFSAQVLPPFVWSILEATKGDLSTCHSTSKALLREPQGFELGNSITGACTPHVLNLMKCWVVLLFQWRHPLFEGKPESNLWATVDGIAEYSAEKTHTS